MTGNHKRIKIAYVIDQLGTGGTERQLKYLADGLDRDSFAVTIFLLRGQENHPLRPRYADVEILGVESLLSLNGFRKLFRFAKHLKENKYQIVQTYFQDATAFGVLAAKLARVPNVFISVRDMGFWATPVSATVHRMISDLADALIVNSTAVEKNARRHSGNTPIHVVYNGVPLGPDYIRSPEAKERLVSELGLEKGKPIVVLVSNCNRAVKRVDLLIESLPIVLEKADAFFLIVGDGHLRPTLEARASKLTVQNNVRFLGQRRDVENILAGADIALNTSDSEGLSNSVIEAMRAGLPVIASDVEGNRELIEDGEGGLLFPAGDFKALAERIMRLLRNPALAVNLGDAARLRIEKGFSVSEMIENYSRLYRSVTAYGRKLNLI